MRAILCRGLPCSCSLLALSFHFPNLASRLEKKREKTISFMKSAFMARQRYRQLVFFYLEREVFKKDQKLGILDGRLISFSPFFFRLGSWRYLQEESPQGYQGDPLLR